MGEEADADWQAGLVEWGIEDAEAAHSRRLIRCPSCNSRFRSPSAVEQHHRDKHGAPRHD